MRIRFLILAAVAAFTVAVLAPTAQADRVSELSTVALQQEARKVGTHGGILCHTIGVGHACATTYMRRLVRELIIRKFPRGEPTVWALCVAGRESGLNPAAASRTNDHGVGQLNAPSHTWVEYNRIAWRSTVSRTGWASDPVYSVAVFHRLSNGGDYSRRFHWAGGAYSCP